LVSGIYGEIVNDRGEIVSYEVFKSNIANGNAMAQNISSLSDNEKRSIYYFLSNILKYDKALAPMLGTGWHAVKVDEKAIEIEKVNNSILYNLNNVPTRDDFAVQPFKNVFEILVGPLKDKYQIHIATDTNKINYYKTHFSPSDKERFLKILSDKGVASTTFGRKFPSSIAPTKKKVKYI